MRGWFGSRFSARLQRQTSPFGGWPLEREYHKTHTGASFEVMGKQCKAMRKADGQHNPTQYMVTRKTWK